MTEQDDTMTILIAPAEGGGYTASVPGLDGAAASDTMAEALGAVLRTVTPIPPNGVQIKIRAGTRIAAIQFVRLLEELRSAMGDTDAALRYAECLDLSNCELEAIDLSAAALDTLDARKELRVQGGGIILTGIRLEGANLAGTQFQGARLFGAQLNGADMTGADFQSADLRQASLQDSNLNFANLEDATAWGANLRGASLWYAKLQGAHLGNADLRGLDLRPAATLNQVRWHNALMEKSWVYRHQIEPVQDELDATCGAGPGTFREAMETYLTLKTNFLSLGNYEDASWAYVKEQQMEKAGYFPTSAGRRWLVGMLARARLSPTDELSISTDAERRLISAVWNEPPRHWWSFSPQALHYRLFSVWLHIQLFAGRAPPEAREQVSPTPEGMDRLRWARNWLYELLTGYGERPQMPLLWGAMTIIIFALIFFLAGNISSVPGAAPHHDFLAALTHSIAAFATMGFNDLQPVGWGARLLTAVEAMLGIGIFALFVYTLGNRMSRS